MKLKKSDKLFIDTKSVLVDKEIHYKLRMLSAKNNMTIIDCADQIFEWFFKNFEK